MNASASKTVVSLDFAEVQKVLLAVERTPVRCIDESDEDAFLAFIGRLGRVLSSAPMEARRGAGVTLEVSDVRELVSRAWQVPIGVLTRDESIMVHEVLGSIVDQVDDQAGVILHG